MLHRRRSMLDLRTAHQQQGKPPEPAAQRTPDGPRQTDVVVRPGGQAKVLVDLEARTVEVYFPDHPHESTLASEPRRASHEVPPASDDRLLAGAGRGRYWGPTGSGTRQVEEISRFDTSSSDDDEDDGLEGCGAERVQVSRAQNQTVTRVNAGHVTVTRRGVTRK